MVRGTYGARHRCYQWIRTCSIGENSTISTERQGVCHAEIPEGSHQGGSYEEDIHLARVRITLVVFRSFTSYTCKNRIKHSISSLWTLNCGPRPHTHTLTRGIFGSRIMHRIYLPRNAVQLFTLSLIVLTDVKIPGAWCTFTYGNRLWN